MLAERCNRYRSTAEHVSMQTILLMCLKCFLFSDFKTSFFVCFCSSALSVIDVSGNRIGDSGARSLLSLLGVLPLLRSLGDV